MRNKKGFLYRADRQCWQYRTTAAGKRFVVYGKTQAECEQKAAVKAKRIQRGMFLEEITLADYFEEWNESRTKTVKASTRYANMRHWEHIKPYLGSRKIASIKRNDVHRLQRVLADRLTSAGVNAAVALLNGLMRAAVFDRIIEYNPCEGVKPVRRTERQATDTNHRALTIEEQELFFSYARESHYYGLLAFMLSTGVRLGEAAALLWSDIDSRRRLVSINKTVSRTGNKEFVISDTPKTRESMRLVPLTETAAGILEEQRRKNMGQADVVPIDGRIFSTTGGSLITPATLCSCIRAILRKIKKETGVEIEYFSSHAMRDTFATRAIEQGMDMKTLSVIMGHSTISMTMDKYAHVLPDTKAAAMDRLVISI